MSATARLRDLDPETLRAPWALYDGWRASGPVVALPELGGWAVTDHALACAVLRDAATWSSDSVDGPRPDGYEHWIAELTAEAPELAALLELPPQALLALDPPEHTVLRRVLMPWLAAAGVRRLQPLVDEHVAALAPALLTGEPVDAVAAFARPLPVAVTGGLLGLAPGEHDEFAALAGAASTSNPHRETKATLRARLHAEVELMRRFGERLDAPPDGGVIAGLRDAVAAGTLSRRGALGLCRELVVAGTETIADHVAALLLLLARDPALLTQVRDDADARAALTEEALRLESPFTGFWRRARNATELAGEALPADAHLLIPFGALNRDPAAFPAPARLDLDRTAPRRHLAFGHGIHFCIGAPLARLQSERVLAALAPAIERVELLAEPEYHASIQSRGVRALRLRVITR
jgi:cytochrome P450